MKIIKQSVLIKNTEWLTRALQGIEYAARISHRSEDGQTESSADSGHRGSAGGLHHDRRIDQSR